SPRRPGARPALLLPDQEILELLALGDLRGQPARLLAAAGPGFGGVGRIAVLRRHLAQLAPGGLLRGLPAGCLRGAAAGAEQFLDGVTLGGGEIDDPLADRGDRLALPEHGLATL